MINLYSDLVFCNDSVLRIKSSRNGSDIFYPLLALQNYYHEDESFLLRVFRCGILIEENTVLSSIILALEPWAEWLSKFVDSDIKAYGEACKTPAPCAQEFECLVLSQRTYISRHYILLSKDKETSITEFLNQERTATPFFDVETDYQCLGIAENDANQYSVSDIAFNRLRNTPVRVSRTQQTIFSGKEFDALVGQLDGISKSDLHQAATFQSPVQMTLDQLLQAVFIDGLFYDKPLSEQGSQSLFAEIHEALEACISQRSQPDLRLVDVDSEHQDDPEYKIVVAPGAFDCAFEHQSEQDLEWEGIYRALIGASNVKIGCLKFS